MTRDPHCDHDWQRDPNIDARDTYRVCTRCGEPGWEMPTDIRRSAAEETAGDDAYEARYGRHN